LGGSKCHRKARFVAHFRRTRRLDFGHRSQGLLVIAHKGKETGFHNEKSHCQNGQKDHQNRSKDQGRDQYTQDCRRKLRRCRPLSADWNFRGRGSLKLLHTDIEMADFYWLTAIRGA
jgi:hypothetical protein